MDRNEDEGTASAAQPPDMRRFGTMIGLAGRQWRRAVDLRLQSFDLTEATWMPLVQLARADGPMRQKDLAAALSLDSSSVVRVLRNLETAGLIARDENEADRRAKAIVITRAGRKRAQQVVRVSKQLEQDLLAGVAPADLAAARRVLAHICDQLVKLNDKAPGR